MKLWNYVFLAITLMIVLEVAGLDTGLNEIKTLIGFNLESGSDINNSPLWSRLFGSTGILLLTLTTGLVIIGAFVRVVPENYILLPFLVYTLTKFIQTYVMILNYTKELNPSWVYYVISIIFLPIAALYIVAAAEFFRGTD